MAASALGDSLLIPVDIGNELNKHPLLPNIELHTKVQLKMKECMKEKEFHINLIKGKKKVSNKLTKGVIVRSSHPGMFLVKDVLKICSKLTGEHPCRSVISIKLLPTLMKSHLSMSVLLLITWLSEICLTSLIALV